MLKFDSDFKLNHELSDQKSLMEEMNQLVVNKSRLIEFPKETLGSIYSQLISQPKIIRVDSRMADGFHSGKLVLPDAWIREIAQEVDILVFPGTVYSYSVTGEEHYLRVMHKFGNGWDHVMGGFPASHFRRIFCVVR
jgi:hypothetical protein